MRSDDLWGTGLPAWKWAEVFALLLVFLAIDLKPQLLGARTARVGLGLVALAMFVHVAVWMTAEVRRRFW